MADEPTTDKSEPEPDVSAFSKVVRLNYAGAEDVVAIFADQAMVQHTPQYFIVSFFQTQLPFTERKEDLLKLEQVLAKCVSRVVVTPQFAVQLRDALTKNIQKYETAAEYVQAHGEPPEIDAEESK